MPMIAIDATKPVCDIPMTATDGGKSTQQVPFTVLDTELMSVLEVHCDAMNMIHDESLNEWMLVVDEHIREISNEIDRARYLFQISLAMNVITVAPVAVTLYNLLNLIGLYACVAALTIVGSSAGIKIGGNKALEDVAAMIRDSPHVIEERTCENAITRKSTTMVRLLELLRRKFGGEKAHATYILLVSKLKARTTRKMFDVAKIPQVATCDEWMKVDKYNDEENYLMPAEAAAESDTRVNVNIANIFDVNSRLHLYENAVIKVARNQYEYAAAMKDLHIVEMDDSWNILASDG